MQLTNDFETSAFCRLVKHALLYTRQILQTASMVAADLLKPEGCAEDGVPLVQPISCGREGDAPVVIRLPTLHDEASKLAELLAAAHQQGHAWGDTAIICRHYAKMERCAAVLRQRRLPHEVRRAPARSTRWPTRSRC